MHKERKTKVRHIGLTAVLIVLIGFFIGIVIFTLSQINSNNKTSNEVFLKEESKDQEVLTPVDTSPNICVLKDVDITEKTMLLYDITKDTTVRISYTGGTDIRDQYSQIITAAQLVLGDIVEVTYDESTQALQSLKESTQSWEYTYVTGLNPDLENKFIRLYGQKYRYTSKLYVRTQDGEGTLLSVNAHDVLTVRGYEQTIHSITVTKGHGSIVLENSDYFEGALITIDGKEYADISSGMIFTVGEGVVEVTVEKEDVKGTTTVDVIRNEQVALDLSIFAPIPEQMGQVTFLIEPFGASLYIDGELMSYSNPLEITYGEHEIEVLLNGYETYYGTYVLEQPSDIVQIVLPETVVDENTDSSTTDDNASDSNEDSSGSSDGSSSSGSSSSNSNSSNSGNSSNNESTQEDENDSSSDKNNTFNENNDVDSEHTISISAPKGVSVYVNGNYKGITPLTLEKPIGITYITLLKEGYQQITHTVNILDDGEDKKYTFPNLELVED